MCVESVYDAARRAEGQQSGSGGNDENEAQRMRRWSIMRVVLEEG